jgi:tetratricopeptide (TPR) repeat protein
MTSAVVCLVGLTEFLAWYFGAAVFPGFAQGWWDIGGWQQPIPPTIYRLAITLNGSTPLSAYLALLIPPAIGLVLTLSPKDQNRQALYFWLVLAFLVQILTFSRAGVLALAISLSLTVLGWILASDGKRSSFWSWRQWPLRYRVFIIVSGSIIMGMALFWLQRSFAGRVGSTQIRFVLWDTALTIFQHHFLTGAGPGNFGRALLRLNQADLPRFQIASAHNVYLNTAAELGLIGLLAGVYVLFMVGRAWWQRWRQLPETPAHCPERIRLITCGAALVGLATQTLVDSYSATPNILPMLALVAYIASDLKLAPAPGKQRFAAYLTAALLLVYAAGFAWMARADLYFQNSFTPERPDNLSQAAGQAAHAHALDPYLALRTFRLASVKARLAEQTNDAQSLQDAIDYYRAGLSLEPIWGLNSANLAGVLWQAGEQTEAIDTLQHTITAEKDPLYLVNLGYFYEQTGDWVKAGAAYGQALALAPNLAGSGFWLATPARVAKWPVFVEQALQQNSSADEAAQRLLRVNLALARAEFDEIEGLIGPVSASTDPDGQLRAALAEVYLSRAQPERAGALLDPTTLTSAQDYLLWGRINLQLADLAAVEKWLKTAVFLGDSRAYFYLGQLYEQQGDFPAAEAAYWHGFSPHYLSENIEVTIYGRSGGNDLVPQLLRIGVSPAQAAPWLELARLYEAQERFEEAKQVYELLLVEDPFLTIGRERLALLEAKQ